MARAVRGLAALLIGATCFGVPVQTVCALHVDPSAGDSEHACCERTAEPLIDCDCAVAAHPATVPTLHTWGMSAIQSQSNGDFILLMPPVGAMNAHAVPRGGHATQRAGPPRSLSILHSTLLL